MELDDYNWPYVYKKYQELSGKERELAAERYLAERRQGNSAIDSMAIALGLNLMVMNGAAEYDDIIAGDEIMEKING